MGQAPSGEMTTAPQTAADRPAHVPEALVVDFDIMLDAGLTDDVHGRIAQVRAGAPEVAWSPYQGGHWLVFGREALRQVLSGDAAFSSRSLAIGMGEQEGHLIPLTLDPPAHTPYRHLLLRTFGPREIKAMEPFVRAWAERLIDPLAGRAECDFIAAVAEPMPISVFMELMGLPLERFEEFRALAVAILSSTTPLEARMGLNLKIVGILSEIFAARRAAPRDDLVSRLISETIDGRPLSEQELLSMGFLLFLAGLDTVTNAMGYIVRRLAAEPQRAAALRGDPARIPDAVEDLLAQHAFVNTTRLATRDVELCGVHIREGDYLRCVLWAGSNEPGASGAHMAFGSGPHICLGMHLARLELKVMLETWLARIPAFRLDPARPARMHGGTVMGIETLPLLLD